MELRFSTFEKYNFPLMKSVYLLAISATRIKDIILYLKSFFMPFTFFKYKVLRKN